MVKQLLYPLANLVRRVEQFMNRLKRNRDIALILLGLIASVISQNLFYLATQHWNTTWQAILIIAFVATLTITAMVIAIIVVYKGIVENDTKLEEAEDTRDRKRDDKLTQAITQSLQDAIERAVQKQSEVIINAIREPRDGHE
jgi:Na+/H+ antiporter NhaB